MSRYLKAICGCFSVCNVESMNWDSVNNEVPMFGFEGETHDGKVVNVYDGDTVKIVMKMFEKFYRFNCRIEGVDTPELRTRNKKEKAMGIKVRDELRKKILDKMVKVKCGEFDKYGRLLVDIIIDNTSITKWLIENKFAFSYDGGKKSWAEYLENEKLKNIHSSYKSFENTEFRFYNSFYKHAYLIQ